MYSLTPNALETIFNAQNGQELKEMDLQVMSVKSLQANANSDNPVQRFRLVLSDGKYYAQAMIVTQLNELVTSNLLRKYSVVRVTRYNISLIQGRKLLILMDLKPLSGLNEDVPKIGFPETPVPGSNANNSNNAPPPPQQANPAAAAPPPQPVIRATAPNAGDHQVFFKIKVLSPYQNKWKIRARAVNKSEIRTWSNQRGEGKLFSVTFMDDSGEIRATAFNDGVTQFYDLIEDGKVYYVSNAVVKVVTNRQYSTVNNEYELSFNSNTIVTPCTDGVSDVPNVQFNFLPLHNLGETNKDDNVDVLGVVHDVSDLSEITSQRTQRKLLKREVTIVSSDEFAVKVTLWGSQAENFRLSHDGQYGMHPIVAIQKAKVSDFGGRQLSVSTASIMTINPDIGEAHSLRGWYDSTGSQLGSWKSFSSASNTVAGSNNQSGPREDKFKALGELSESGIGAETKPDFFSVRGTVERLVTENFAYPACPSESCNRKVIEGSEGWRCESCNRSFPAPEYRYILNLLVVDFTGTQWMTAFNDTAQAMLNGRTANELMELQRVNSDELKSSFDVVLHKEYIFNCRAKVENFQGVSKLRVAVTSAAPVDFVSDSRKLIENLEQYLHISTQSGFEMRLDSGNAWPM